MMVTSSVEVQDKFVVLHLNVTEVPTTIPVTVDVGEDGVVIVAIPDTTDQLPLPTVGVLPESVVLVTLQRLILLPALAAVGGSAMVITTSSVDAPQAGLEMLQRKVTEVPTVKPVTVEVGDPGVVIVPVPDTTLHDPVPITGVLPASVVDVTLHMS